MEMDRHMLSIAVQCSQKVSGEKLSDCVDCYMMISIETLNVIYGYGFVIFQ